MALPKELYRCWCYYSCGRSHELHSCGMYKVQNDSAFQSGSKRRRVYHTYQAVQCKDKVTELRVCPKHAMSITLFMPLLQYLGY